MLTSMVLSVLFLISYICHHLFAGEAKFGDIDHNGVLTDAEKMDVGSSRFVYYFILGTHIPLAGIVLPFILFTAYRALIGEFDKHQKACKDYLANLVLCGRYRRSCVPNDQPILQLVTHAVCGVYKNTYLTFKSKSPCGLSLY